MKSLQNVAWEAKQYYGHGQLFGGNAGNNGTKKQHVVSCARRGGCAIAAKVMEIETKPGMSKTGKWGNGDGGAAVLVRVTKSTGSMARSTTPWEHDSSEITKKEMKGAQSSTHPRPLLRTHRQDMQGITNVIVTRCDGHSELANKGTTAPTNRPLHRRRTLSIKRT